MMQCESMRVTFLPENWVLSLSILNPVYDRGVRCVPKEVYEGNKKKNTPCYSNKTRIYCERDEKKKTKI